MGEIARKPLISNGWKTLGAFAVLIVVFVLWNHKRIQMEFVIWQVRSIIKEGQQGWPRNVEAKLDEYLLDSNKHEQLALRLIEEDDGSLIAMGLLMLEEQNHTQLNEFLDRFAEDDRWTWHLSSVGEVALEIEERRPPMPK